jgi:riboflavin kinase / FMN adenylyltransferase
MSEPAPQPESSSTTRSTPGLVVIGNFDGVHLGHLYVLQQAAQRALRDGLQLRVLTFDPHPRQVVKGEIVPVLTTTERKRNLLLQRNSQIDLVVLKFTPEVADYSPEEFVDSILVQQLRAKRVVVGQNFRFGRGRTGDLQTLTMLGERFGISATAEALHGDEVGVFSSTRIRNLLGDGDVVGAAQILGRPHLISGHVIRGDQRGRTLGFPTANLGGVAEVLPRDGVYAVQVYDLGDNARYLGPGALNLGVRPTVDRPYAAEVHLIDFEGDLYGRELAVELIAPVRTGMKFQDLKALTDQIGKDLRETSKLLAACPAPAVAPGFS